jgi:hypothetical protein
VFERARAGRRPCKRRSRASEPPSVRQHEHAVRDGNSRIRARRCRGATGGRHLSRESAATDGSRRARRCGTDGATTAGATHRKEDCGNRQARGTTTPGVNNGDMRAWAARNDQATLLVRHQPMLAHDHAERDSIRNRSVGPLVPDDPWSAIGRRASGSRQFISTRRSVFAERRFRDGRRRTGTVSDFGLGEARCIAREGCEEVACRARVMRDAHC